MNSPSTVELNAISLKAENYDVVPLNRRVAGSVFELERALQRGAPIFPDRSRSDFYDAELDNGWAYIHVREDTRTVYLVAAGSNVERECALKGTTVCR